MLPAQPAPVACRRHQLRRIRRWCARPSPANQRAYACAPHPTIGAFLLVATVNDLLGVLGLRRRGLDGTDTNGDGTVDVNDLLQVLSNLALTALWMA